MPPLAPRRYKLRAARGARLCSAPPPPRRCSGRASGHARPGPFGRSDWRGSLRYGASVGDPARARLGGASPSGAPSPAISRQSPTSWRTAPAEAQARAQTACGALSATSRPPMIRLQANWRVRRSFRAPDPGPRCLFTRTSRICVAAMAVALLQPTPLLAAERLGDPRCWAPASTRRTATSCRPLYAPVVKDWQSVAPAGPADSERRPAARVDTPCSRTGTYDGCFIGGVKEDTPDDWEFNETEGGCVPGQVRPARHVVARRDDSRPTGSCTPPSSAARRPATRSSPSSSTASATTAWTNGAGTSIPCRSDGDLLLSYEVGGSSVSVSIYRWTGDTPARPAARTAPTARSPAPPRSTTAASTPPPSPTTSASRRSRACSASLRATPPSKPTFSARRRSTSPRCWPRWASAAATPTSRRRRTRGRPRRSPRR